MGPPPNLSCPSSSASTIASSYVRRYVQTALTSAGFARSSGQAIDVLTEVLERYLLLLGSTAQRYASHTGRTKACAWDAEAALQDLGSSSEEVQAWLLEDGVDMAGRWQFLKDGNGSASTSTSPGIKALKMYTSRAKSLLGKGGPLPMYYDDVTPSELDELEMLLSHDEDDCSSVEGMSPITSSSASTSQHHLRNDVDINTVHTYRKRKRSPSADPIVPTFLPAFPRKQEGQSVDWSSVGVMEDGDYAREMAMAIRNGTERSSAVLDVKTCILSTDATYTDPEAAVDDARTTAAVQNVTVLPKRSVEDLWQSAVPFSASMLASGQSPDDVPTIVQASPKKSWTVELPREASASSMRAFANDYCVLVQESRQSAAPGYLTPSGGAYARVFHQRRAVAAYLSDSSKYVPCDTIFGSVGARPTALPFQPLSSMLVTPPTSLNPAPTFTPLRPNGRDLPSTTVQSNALYPVCRHRIPTNVLNAARLVSGGVGTETYRRMTRIHDPEPILDERHAERVFHGQPAPKDLLADGNSFLKGALDVMTIKRAEERAVARGEAGEDGTQHGDLSAGLVDKLDYDADGKQTSQLSMSATRDKIKVKSGTIVSTWDWMTRDHTDPVLPAKRYRSRTVGVMLSGRSGNASSSGGDGARSRERSESVTGTPTTGP